MRAVVNTPDRPERIEIAAGVEEPRAREDEALVAVEAFSLNRGELALLANRPEGWRLGQDIAGSVISAAADGSGPAVGTRVVGLVEEGGWAEQVTVPTSRLAPVPDGVTSGDAATLGLAGRTALHTVALGGALLGRRVLVTGASGGLGRFQVQLAALSGARVTAVSRRAAAVEDLVPLGASSVVARVEDAPGLFDLVLDGVGGRTISAAIAKVAPGGTVLLVGASDGEPGSVRLTDFFGHENATIRTYFSYREPSPIAADFADLLELLAGRRLVTSVGLQAEWTELPGALDALAENRVDGKAVLTVS